MATVIGRGGETITPVRAPVLSFGVSPTAGTLRADLDYELQTCRVVCAALGPSTLSFRLRTGRVKQPHRPGYESTPRELALMGKWVSLRLSGPTGTTAPVFVGVIITERATLFGADPADTGSQSWLAVSALHLLNRVTVSHAFWDVDGLAVRGHYMPSFNAGDPLGSRVGNRSANPVGLSYVFGGVELWTRRQAVEYLLAHFADSPGILWTVAGDTLLIDGATDTVEMGQVGTLGNAIRRILSPQFAMDFTVEPTAEGFELRVFSLSPADVTFNSQTVPANRRTTAITIGEDPTIERVEMTRNQDQQHNSIRLTGRRIVVALTLGADRGHLIPKWSTAIEAEYLEGAGTGDPAPTAEDHDQARRSPRLRSVFATLGAPEGFELRDVAAGIETNEAGEVATTDGLHQTTFRATLDYTPLREGVDYSQTPAEDNATAGYGAAFVPPSAFVFDEDTQRFVPAEAAGFELTAPASDWGVQLRADARHLLALNRWTGAAGTQTVPRYDVAKVVATVAVQLDNRLTMQSFLPDGNAGGGVLDVEAPGAELWCIAPGTVVGIRRTDGALLVTEELTIVRDGRERMAAQMAALIARYLRERARGSVMVRGLEPWSTAVGSILTAVTQGGSDEEIGAPITAVEYTGGGAPGTVIRAGYE